MKTAGEIKTALGMCRCGAECNFCPYTFSECSKNQLEKDALQYIAQLEAELEAVKLQRDMAVERYKRMLETAAILSDAVTELEKELENDGR